MIYPEIDGQWSYPDNVTTIFLKECDSTNNYLKSNQKRFQDKYPVMVMAKKQTAGRGRLARSWLSAANTGLYLSFAFKLKPSVNINLLSIIAGISTLEFIARIGQLELSLKWPNDIVCQNKKIAGILIENQFNPDHIVSITGIGVNFNHRVEDFPASLSQQAISLKMVTGKTYKLDQVAPLLTTIFFQWVEKLETGRWDIILQTATCYSQRFLDREIQFSQEGRVIRGVFRGLSQKGGLIIEVDDSRKTIFYTGEILK